MRQDRLLSSGKVDVTLRIGIMLSILFLCKHRSLSLPSFVCAIIKNHEKKTVSIVVVLETSSVPQLVLQRNPNY